MSRSAQCQLQRHGSACRRFTLRSCLTDRADRHEHGKKKADRVRFVGHSFLAFLLKGVKASAGREAAFSGACRTCARQVPSWAVKAVLGKELSSLRDIA